MGRDPCREREDHYHRHKCAFPASGALLKKPSSSFPSSSSPSSQIRRRRPRKNSSPPRGVHGKSGDFCEIPPSPTPGSNIISFWTATRSSGYFPLLSLSPPKAEVERGEYYAERKGGSPYIREISHGQERGDDDKCSVFMQVGKRKEGEGKEVHMTSCANSANIFPSLEELFINI